MKGNYKRSMYFLLGIIVFLTVSSICVNWWVNVKLPDLITEKNETPYHIKYDKLKISLLSRTIEASGITIAPKEREKDSLSKNGIFATVDQIEINNFELFALLFTSKIKAQTITVQKPVITLFKDSDKTVNSSENISNKVVAPFEKFIKVANVNLNQGSFFIVNLKNNKTLFSAYNVTIQLDDIVISEETLKRKIPLNYTKYAFSCDSLFYQTDNFYQIRTAEIITTQTGLEVNAFSMKSAYNRSQFVKQLEKEKDLFTLKINQIIIKNMDWGFKNEILFFKTNQILIKQAAANIYRSKVPQDDLSIKPLYNKLLRELPFELKVDALIISDSKLVYEEEKSFSKGAGILEFTSFNLQATNLNSGFLKTKLPDVVISIDCKFMKTSSMKIDWRFNPMDKTDSFKIKGRILDFDTKQLAVFTKPYLNATTTGTFDQVYFNFSGNDDLARGDFALKYHGLKVKLYQKKNREKESKLKTWIGNLILQNDSNEQLIENEVYVARIKEKSFYNYFWRCIGEGIKKTLI